MKDLGLGCPAQLPALCPPQAVSCYAQLHPRCQCPLARKHAVGFSSVTRATARQTLPGTQFLKSIPVSARALSYFDLSTTPLPLKHLRAARMYSAPPREAALRLEPARPSNKVVSHF